MSYKYFGRLAGGIPTAKQALKETAPPNTKTPFNAQAPATKFLAYGEDATSLAFNRAFAALSANADYLAHVLDSPTVKDVTLSPTRQTAVSAGNDTPDDIALGPEGYYESGLSTLSGGTSSASSLVHLLDTSNGAGGESKTPITWVYLGLHKSKIGSNVQFYQTSPNTLHHSYSSSYTGTAHVGPQVGGVGGLSDPYATHTTTPIDAYRNSADANAGVSYWSMDYKLGGDQKYLANVSEGMPIHVPPIQRIKAQVTPYAGDWKAVNIYKFDSDGVYLQDHTFSELFLRPGCFVEISGDGDEHVNHGNNGLFQIASVIGSDHKPADGGQGDKAILTRGGLCRVTVRDWRVFGRGEMVSWASAPNHNVDVNKPGERDNYAYVAYIVPRPDIEVAPASGDYPGDLYLSAHSALDDFKHGDSGRRIGSPSNAGSARYEGIGNAGFGTLDPEDPVKDHLGNEINNALQNHGILPGTRLYHGHAHFYPDQSPWNLPAEYASAYSDVLSKAEGGAIVGPGEPVVFDTTTAAGRVWPCSPAGFSLNPSFHMPDDNQLRNADYMVAAKTLTTVRESLIESSVSAGGVNTFGINSPKEALLDKWLKYVKYGSVTVANANADDLMHGSDKLIGSQALGKVVAPRHDNLNDAWAPTATLLGADLWEVTVVLDSTAGPAVGDQTTFESHYASWKALGNNNIWPTIGNSHELAFWDVSQPYMDGFLGVDAGSERTHTKARIVAVDGNKVTFANVFRAPTSFNSNNTFSHYHLHDGWTENKKLWPITDQGDKSKIKFNIAGSYAIYKVEQIHKAPVTDNLVGNLSIPRTGLDGIYNNSLSANPALRGDLGTAGADNIHVASGTGNEVWVNPARPITLILPGGDELDGLTKHPHEWASGKGEVGLLTKNNNKYYAVMARMTRRYASGDVQNLLHSNDQTTSWNDGEFSLGEPRLEISWRYGSSHAHRLTHGWFNANSDGNEYAPSSWKGLAGTHLFTYSESMVGGYDKSKRMLLVDETTSEFGVSPEIGEWLPLETRSGDQYLTVNPDSELTHATADKEVSNLGVANSIGPKQGVRPGVFLSNNLSKVRQRETDGAYYPAPDFDSRSTPEEMQDRSILGSIEGTLLGNYVHWNSRAQSVGDAGLGLKDVSSFGVFSNGVIKGGKAWSHRQQNDSGFPEHRLTLNPSVSTLYIAETYLLVGGAKWYQPEFVFDVSDVNAPYNFQQNGDALVVWNANDREYKVSALDSDGNYLFHHSSPALNGTAPVWWSAEDIPICIVTSVNNGVEVVTDVRMRVHRQERKTSLYVGSVVPSHETVDANGGYVSDEMNFSTIGEALKAIEWWDKGQVDRNWTIEVVGPTTEKGDQYRGITIPYKLPCNGITVRGLRGRGTKSATDAQGHGPGWSGLTKGLDTVKANYSGDSGPVITWGDRGGIPKFGLFDMDCRYGITFEDLSFVFDGDLNKSLPGPSMVQQGDLYQPGGIAATYHPYGAWPMDCLFVTGNDAYTSDNSVDMLNDRESRFNTAGYAHPLNNQSSAFAGGWTFRNIDLQNAGGLLCTLNSFYEIDGITIENCSARSCLSFATLGINTGDLTDSGIGFPNQDSKYIANVSIRNNYACFPTVKHYAGGNPEANSSYYLVQGLDCLTHWVPVQGGQVNEYKNIDGQAGEVTGLHARYRSGVYAMNCKHINVESNRFERFYYGIAFAPNSLRWNNNYMQYCEGVIDGNTITYTQSTGIYATAAHPKANITITNNTVTDPGMPLGATTYDPAEPGSTKWGPNIFDLEAWCIKAMGKGYTISGNRLQNTWRQSSKLNLGWHSHVLHTDKYQAVFDRCDKTGTEKPGGHKTAYQAGAIQLFSHNSIMENDSGIDTIVSGNSITVAGRAIIGVCLTNRVPNAIFTDNSINFEPQFRHEYNNNDVVHNRITGSTNSRINDAAHKLPWGFWVGDNCHELKITNSRIGGSIRIGANSPRCEISGNTISADSFRYKSTNLNNDATRSNTVISVAGNCPETTIHNNRVSLGFINIGTPVSSMYNCSITNNDLTFQNQNLMEYSTNELRDMLTAPPTGWPDPYPNEPDENWDCPTGIWVDGFAANLSINHNRTYGGQIRIAGASASPSLKVIGNSTGSLNSTRRVTYDHSGQPNNDHAFYTPIAPYRDVLGADIIVGMADDVVVSDNDTAGGSIRLGAHGNGPLNNPSFYVGAVNNLTASGNILNGGSILFSGCNASIANNILWTGRANQTGTAAGTNPYWDSGRIHAYDSWAVTISGNAVCGPIFAELCHGVKIDGNRGRYGFELKECHNAVVSRNSFIGMNWRDYSGNGLVNDSVNVSIDNNKMSTAEGQQVEFGKHDYRNTLDLLPVIFPADSLAEAVQPSWVDIWGAEGWKWGHSGTTDMSDGPPVPGSISVVIGGATQYHQNSAHPTIETCGGKLTIRNSPGVVLDSNQANQAHLLNCPKAVIKKNKFNFGGAMPAGNNNFGVKVEWDTQGASRNTTVLENEVAGNIQVGVSFPIARSIYNNFYIVERNIVGTIMSGGHYLRTNTDSESYPDGVGWPDFYNSIGLGTDYKRAWKGGGGYIVVDEKGGAVIKGNDTVSKDYFGSSTLLLSTVFEDDYATEHTPMYLGMNFGAILVNRYRHYQASKETFADGTVGTFNFFVSNGTAMLLGNRTGWTMLGQGMCVRNVEYDNPTDRNIVSIEEAEDEQTSNKGFGILANKKNVFVGVGNPISNGFKHKFYDGLNRSSPVGGIHKGDMQDEWDPGDE
tara:strand:+ start:208 stop:8415 length:8208 start_codon:yes stop_codon:yes gene_type:complete